METLEFVNASVKVLTANTQTYVIACCTSYIYNYYVIIIIFNLIQIESSMKSRKRVPQIKNKTSPSDWSVRKYVEND